MNQTSLNNELFAADDRGRKHIPIAVFAVILIHILLFLMLLIAAGCRAKARAKRNAQPAPEMLTQQPTAAPVQALLSTNAPPAELPAEPVVASEPPVERKASVPPSQKLAQRPLRKDLTRATLPASRNKPKIYVVRAGDTVEKIAKMHRTSVEAIQNENKIKGAAIRPGQQIRVSAGQPKPSNEV
ncbi:MAG TPA: LysM peptidoglycan-binding domain-containing protein [Verrucomicrobiae bacterium]|nr:LysM peptidoglycan-binding domain-containing protein [Verrucomicrobiae bacterium]